MDGISALQLALRMNILLVQTGFLGDVILSTPVINGLRAIYPQAKLSILTTPSARDLVRFHPAVNETLVYDKRGVDSGLVGFYRCVRKLRAAGFEAAFSLHKSHRTALLLRFAGIPQRYGFAEASLPFLYTKTCPRSDLGHDALRNLAIFRNLGCEPDCFDQKLQVEVPLQAKEKAQTLLSFFGTRKKVGIAPGSVWSTKRWRIEGFAEVAQRFAAENCAIVILGGKADVGLAEEIEKACGGAVLNLVGNTTLIESAAVISLLDVLVSNDSAPLHLASAAGVPVCALFCATVPEFGFTPWKTSSVVLGVSGLSCRPCGRHGAKKCVTGTHDCQYGITADAVCDAVRRLLA